jgi:hypothetical protein
MTIPIPPKGPKVTATVFGSLGTDDIGQLITGHDNGDIVQWDIRSKQKVKIVSDHAKAISDIQLSADSEFCLDCLLQCRTMPCFRDNVHLGLQGQHGQALRRRHAGLHEDLHY